MNWENVFQFLFEFAASWGFKILGALIILAAGVKIIGFSLKRIKKSPRFAKLDKGLHSFLISFLNIALYAILFITIAMILGIPATSFITMLASCGVAIGLALQGALSNFAGGLMILFFKPFRVGDFITASGESGTVQEISVVYTVLLTPDNKRITIPNGTLTNSVIENYSMEKTRRVDFTFGASYGSDVDEVKQTILSVITSHALVLSDPEPMVRLSSHDDSALTYTARAWVESADYWTVFFDVTEGVKKAFDEKGIEIPYPQLDVHVTK